MPIEPKKTMYTSHDAAYKLLKHQKHAHTHNLINNNVERYRNALNAPIILNLGISKATKRKMNHKHTKCYAN